MTVKKTFGSVGAIVLAATLFRTTGPESTPHEPAATHATAAAPATGNKSTGEGPWAASCEYWAPAKLPAEPASEVQPSFSVTLDKAQNKLTGILPGAPEERQSECGDNVQKRWGIPRSNPRPKVRTLIAIVPDPVHTNMALQFDRTIDALMAATGEYRYVSSYYWLPWKEAKIHLGASAGGPDTTAKSQHAPGLNIFRLVPSLRSSRPIQRPSA